MNFVEVKCAFCGKEFLRRKGQFNEAKKFGWKHYCSRKYLSRDRTKKQVLFCENCGKAFLRCPKDISPHNYCSQSCAAIVNNKKCLKGHAKIKPKLKTCVRCGGHFRKSTGNSKYCSIQCWREAEFYTSKELLEIIRDEARQIGRIPARREMKGIGSACKRFFGSWNNAVVAAGLTPNRSHCQRVYKRTNTKAIDGHLGDSISEALVDNWLFEHQIPHQRDIVYPSTNHKADWAVKVNGQKVFIEYFGLVNDSPRYDRDINKKRELCKINGIPLIEIYPCDLYPQKNLGIKLKNITI